MLADPKANAIVENFAEQWLNLRVLEQLEPDSDLFPGCDAEMLEDMACLLYTSPSPRDLSTSRMPSSA